MKEKLLAILIELRPDIDFEMENSLITDGILESFDLIQLLTLIEDELGIKVNNSDVTIENFDSIDAMTNLIEGLGK